MFKDYGKSNLDTFQQTLEGMNLSSDERRDFYCGFIGALAGNVPKTKWERALKITKECVEKNRACSSQAISHV